MTLIMEGLGKVILEAKDVKDYELVFGNPSVHKGWISEFGEKLIFNNDGIAISLGSGNKYSISNKSVKNNLYEDLLDENMHSLELTNWLNNKN